MSGTAEQEERAKWRANERANRAESVLRKYQEALEIIAAPPTDAPDAIGITARNIAQAALRATAREAARWGRSGSQQLAPTPTARTPDESIRA